MLYINDLVLGCIFLSFPQALYYFYIAYNNRIEAEENNLFLCFALFSSMYLLNLQYTCNYPRLAMLLSNIPIIISLLKDRWKESTLLIAFYILCASNLFTISYVILFIEYTIYMCLYYLKTKKKYNDIIFITMFFLVKMLIYIIRVHVDNCFFDDRAFTEVLYVTIPITYVTTLIVIHLNKIGDEIMRYHITYKELAKEKQIQTSLFKITHEIKNPLAVCKGYLDMIDVNNPKKIEKYIPIVKAEVNHALFILNDFSSLSKLKIEKEDMDVNFLLIDAVKSFRELLSKNKVKVQYSHCHEIIIKGDYKRLMQVLINLFKNSIEAFDENKSNKKIKIILKESKNNVQIIFSDNGCGIDKNSLEKIKDPFYTTKEMGTGLGVSLSNEIITSHNGTLTYESEVGKGTKVTIKLPKK